MKPGDRLPPLRLPDRHGILRPVRPRRGARALFLAHAPDCAGCEEYLLLLSREHDRFHDWNGEVAAVLPHGEISAAVPLLLDLEGSLRARVGFAPTSAGVVVVNHAGQVWEVLASGTGHALPGPGELERVFQFCALQCPEAGVPDTPVQGDWDRL